MFIKKAVLAPTIGLAIGLTSISPLYFFHGGLGVQWSF